MTWFGSSPAIDALARPERRQRAISYESARFGCARAALVRVAIEQRWLMPAARLLQASRRARGEKTGIGGWPVGDAAMNTLRSIVASAALLTLQAEAQVHRFETDPVVTVRENFVACDVLSQLQRVMDNPRFLF